MNQVQERMNATDGMQIIDVSQIVECNLEEVKLQMEAKDTIIKVLLETIESVRNEICGRNQYCFWKKQVDMMDKAISISKGKIP
jgi:uncharacterized membrane protein